MNNHFVLKLRRLEPERERGRREKKNPRSNGQKGLSPSFFVENKILVIFSFFSMSQADSKKAATIQMRVHCVALDLFMTPFFSFSACEKCVTCPPFFKDATGTHSEEFPPHSQKRSRDKQRDTLNGLSHSFLYLRPRKCCSLPQTIARQRDLI